MGPRKNPFILRGDLKHRGHTHYVSHLKTVLVDVSTLCALLLLVPYQTQLLFSQGFHLLVFEVCKTKQDIWSQLGWKYSLSLFSDFIDDSFITCWMVNLLFSCSQNEKAAMVETKPGTNEKRKLPIQDVGQMLGLIPPLTSNSITMLNLVWKQYTFTEHQKCPAISQVVSGRVMLDSSQGSNVTNDSLDRASVADVVTVKIKDCCDTERRGACQSKRLTAAMTPWQQNNTSDSSLPNTMFLLLLLVCWGFEEGRAFWPQYQHP